MTEAELLSTKDATELRELWQARALKHTEGTGLGAVLLSVLAHSYDDALPVLLHVTFPGFAGLRPPGLCSCGKIAKNGAVIADVVLKDGTRLLGATLFRSEIALRDVFRKLADQLKLDDDERREMFGCVQRWVVADQRLNPRMNPLDPDAKRYALH